MRDELKPPSLQAAPPMSLRRGQFTVGIMLFVLAGAGVLLGAWRYATRESRAIAAIERLGGRVIDGEDDFGPFRGVHVMGGDQALALLAHVANVQTLYVDPVDLTDAGLEHIAQIATLEDLSLHNCEITDAGVARLSKLTGLITLGLDHTRVTDVGLVHLAGMGKLTVLDLSGTSVGDKGLEHLRGLKSLRQIHLDGAQVTDTGARRLKAALPDVAVEK